MIFTVTRVSRQISVAVASEWQNRVRE